MEYAIDSEANVSVVVFDLVGSKVFAQEYDGKANQLENRRIDLTSLNNGMYFVTINAGESRITKKIQVVN